jgi:hypothetical protein
LKAYNNILAPVIEDYDKMWRAREQKEYDKVKYSTDEEILEYLEKVKNAKSKRSVLQSGNSGTIPEES